MHSFVNQFRFICIDVNDWRLDSFGNITAVQSCSSLWWGCGETDLVVGDDMNHSSCIIVRKIRHLNCFVSNSLPWHRGISMNDNTQRLAIFPLKRIRISFYMPHCHSVYGLQMRRIGQNGQSDHLFINLSCNGTSQVIIDVTGQSPRYLVYHILLVLSKYPLHWFLKDICQGIDSSSMRHPKPNKLDILLSRLLH